jgi:hypothetical protein
MKRFTLTLVSFTFLLASCSKDDDATITQPTINLPETYNFENVSYTGQENRLDMLSEITTYMKTANNGAALDKTTLENMFLNSGYTWDNPSLAGSTKKLGDKVSPDVQSSFGNWFTAIETASKSTTAGSNGTAGVVTSNSGSKAYLFDENGIEHIQLIEKGAMGAVFYYQATEIYFGDGKMNVDNETVNEGKGTDMQHHWDEAFGYFGVPINFASDGFTYTSGEDYDRFWAKYTNGRDDVLGLNKTLMTSFIKGRDAIGRKDYEDRDEAIAEIRTNWEKVSAATAIHYLNDAKTNFADDALRMHELSEAYAFIWNLKFNPEQKLSDAQIQNDILDTYFTNLYTISIADINAVRDMLSTAYGFDAVKDAL